MTSPVIGIVDYGIGNHASVRHALRDLDFRCRVSADVSVLGQCDLLLLPGVGAFKPAIEALQLSGLDRCVIDWANRGKPILGICLGMQLLAQSSDEGGHTPGLGLIPGAIVALDDQRWHIGWNTIERVNRLEDDPFLRASYGQTFYFNHSYVYRGPDDFCIAGTEASRSSSFASAIRRGRIVGVQFHPEKSQKAGKTLLRELVHGLCNA